MADIDWDLVGRYLAGACTEEERALVERWLAESPDHARRLAAVSWVASHGRDVVSPKRREALWASFQAKAAAATRAPIEPRPIRHLPWQRRSWLGSAALKAAAAVLLVLGASAVGYVVVQSPPSWLQPAASEMRTFSTTRGQRLILRLPDNTQVVLAPASTLRLAATYGARDRAVELVGQAAFTVVHDERRPFVVRADRLVAEDLGTEFVVRAYPEQGDPQVFVREGIVAIRDANAKVGAQVPAEAGYPRSGWDASPVPVHAGQKGRLPQTGAPIVEPTNPSVDFAWTDGRLVFSRTPLRDALAAIERWYDIEVQLASSALGNEGLTATFREQESPASVLGVIATALDLKVVTTGPRSYTLRAR